MPDSQVPFWIDIVEKTLSSLASLVVITGAGLGLWYKKKIKAALNPFAQRRLRREIDTHESMIELLKSTDGNFADVKRIYDHFNNIYAYECGCTSDVEDNLPIDQSNLKDKMIYALIDAKKGLDKSSGSGKDKPKHQKATEKFEEWRHSALSAFACYLEYKESFFFQKGRK